MRGSFVDIRRVGAMAVAGALLVAFTSGEASAQSYGNRNTGWDSKLYYSPQLYSPASPLAAPSREYTGLPIAGWMVYASALTGLVWDDNVFQANAHKTDDWGYRFKPEIEAVHNNGIHNTTIYGSADARFYNEEDDANVVNANLGLSHIWEVRRDLIVRAEFGGWRKTDINNSGTIETGSGLETIVDPLEYNELYGSASVQQSFGRFFFGMGLVASGTLYDDVEDSLGNTIDQSYQDQTTYTFSSRAGAWVSPVFYTFIEPSQNWRSFRDDILNSNGQRVVGGIGTDRISLFRGEIFAGYQRQNYDRAGFDDVTGAVFGGKLYWYPTRDLVWELDVDRSLGDSTLRSAGNENGSPTETTSFLLKGDYLLSDIWKVSGKAGYTFTDYELSTREDSLWVAGTTVSYYVWRNLAATFDYQYINLDSNISVNSFDRNLYTVGATYRY